MLETFQLFATTAKGMEDLLAQELQAMGAREVKKVRAGVQFTGSLETAYRACLWSRIANRILLPLKTFPAPNPEKLYGHVKNINWSDHMDPNQTLAVDFASSQSQITHTHFGALKVKDAIVDQFRSVHGERPSVDVSRPDIRVNVYLHQDEATVSLDLSGDSLHLRGYREEGTEAPLKENLAAAILMTANWPEVAKNGGSFVDLMCGSGTLPIEAALIASNTAPGIQREYFGFLKWRKHDSALWEKLLNEARAKIITDRRLLPRIYGFDIDFRAVRVANSNAAKAGVSTLAHIEKRALAQYETLPIRPGIVMVNPPYGERLGDVEELRDDYALLGDTFKKKFQGWTGYIFTGSPELAKEIGLKASRRHVLFNGAMECRLFEYSLYSGTQAPEGTRRKLIVPGSQT